MHRQILKCILFVFLLQSVFASKVDSDDVLKSAITKANAEKKLLDGTRKSKEQKFNNNPPLKVPRKMVKPHIHTINLHKSESVQIPMEDSEHLHTVLESKNGVQDHSSLPFVKTPKEMLQKIQPRESNQKHVQTPKDWDTKTPGFVKSETLRAITGKESYNIKPKRRTGRPQHALDLHVKQV